MWLHSCIQVTIHLPTAVHETATMPRAPTRGFPRMSRSEYLSQLHYHGESCRKVPMVKYLTSAMGLYTHIDRISCLLEWVDYDYCTIMHSTMANASRLKYSDCNNREKAHVGVSMIAVSLSEVRWLFMTEVQECSHIGEFNIAKRSLATLRSQAHSYCCLGQVLAS